MIRTKKGIYGLIIVLIFGLIPAIVVQFFEQEPSSENIHIRNFRYGKDPSVIRCNRGDTLNLTFSSEDTGHSFFLEEFNMDVKVRPAQKEVSVFETNDPTNPPIITDTVQLITKHKGISNYMVSKSFFRCHVWCGPMHAFEQGKLVIFPNTLLFFSLGCLIGIIVLWLIRLFGKNGSSGIDEPRNVDLFKRFPLIYKFLHSRWPQIIIMIVTLTMMYLVMMIAFFGTKMSGRNFGVLLLWAIWLFVLVAILTPLLGRGWCSVCPMPLIGDWIQRGSLFTPETGKTKGYNNKYRGLFLKWPKALQNHWLKLFFFLIFTTFSTTLVALPWVSGMAVLILLIIPIVMALIWEKRAFCKYICPVSVFVAPFSGLSTIKIKPKDQKVCDNCKAHFCENGSKNGWACPYGLNVGTMDDSIDCGLCMECLRSCSLNNVTIEKRRFGGDVKVKSWSHAFISIAIFVMSIVYSMVYLGTWTEIRDYINILDKHNWDLFGIYALGIWSLALIIAPGILYLLAWCANRFSKKIASTKEIFFSYSSVLLPLGMMLWISFVIPMLFNNITFIAQSASDPFGWGWDFFGTSNIPWHQFMPKFIPWFQAILILIGLSFSLKNLRKRFTDKTPSLNQRLGVMLPGAIALITVAIGMIIFFVN